MEGGFYRFCLKGCTVAIEDVARQWSGASNKDPEDVARQWSGASNKEPEAQGCFTASRMRAINFFVCPSERPSSLRSFSSKAMSAMPRDPAACVYQSVSARQLSRHKLVLSHVALQCCPAVSPCGVKPRTFSAREKEVRNDATDGHKGTTAARKAQPHQRIKTASEPPCHQGSRVAYMRTTSLLYIHILLRLEQQHQGSRVSGWVGGWVGGRLGGREGRRYPRRQYLRPACVLRRLCLWCDLPPTPTQDKHPRRSWRPFFSSRWRPAWITHPSRTESRIWTKEQVAKFVQEGWSSEAKTPADTAGCPPGC